MVIELNEEEFAAATSVTCLECGTVLGGPQDPDPYKHMLHCLNVGQGAVSRIREQAIAGGLDNGKRVVHICDFILGGE